MSCPSAVRARAVVAPLRTVTADGVASTPIARSDASRSESDGVASGEPNTRCTSAPAAQPMANAPRPSPGGTTPSVSADSQDIPMSHRPNFRSGSTKYGLATVTAAAPAASASDGNGTVWSARPRPSNTFETVSSTTHPASATPNAVITMLAAQSRSSVQRLRTSANTAMTTTQTCARSYAASQTKSNRAGNSANQPANAPSRSPGSLACAAVTRMMTSESVSRTTSVGRRNRFDVDGAANARARSRRDRRSDTSTRW